MTARTASAARQGSTANGWRRQELTLRLSRRRLAKLKAIASELPNGATPTEAIDHAIDCANGAPSDHRENLEQIAAALDGLEARADISQAAAERVEARMLALAKSVDALRALISAVAQSEE